MKRLFWVLALLAVLAIPPSWAQEKYNEVLLQNAATGTGTGIMIPVDRYTTVGLDITISATATVTFEGSVSGDTWKTVTCASATDTSAALVQTASASGLYQCNVAGLLAFRARVSAYTSGTVTAFARATTAIATKGGGGGSGGDGKILDGTGAGQADVMSSTPVGTEEGLVVRCIGCTSTGGTSSNYGSAFPSAGTAVGFNDGTNMQSGYAVDVNTGAGTQFAQAINLVKRTAAGGVEVGTASDPIRVDPTGTTTQPVSGTVTVTDGAGALNVIVDSSALPTGASTLGEQQTQTTSLQLIDDLPLAQGSTTSGQKGALAQGAVTTSAPTYTTAQTSPLSLTTGGLLRVAIEAGGGSGGTSSSFGSSFPATGTAIGGSDGTNMQGPRVFDADSGAGTQYVLGANLRSSASGGSTETFAAPAALADATANPTLTGIGSFNMCFNGTTWDRCVKASTGAGAVDANTQRTTHASDDPVTTSVQIIDDLRLAQGSTTSGQAGVLGQGAVTTSAPTYTTAQTSPLSLQTDGSLRTAVTNTVAITANSSVNVAQINGVATTMGNGISGTGVQRVTIASDSTGIVGLATGANTIGALSANQSVNVAQVNGVTTSTGVGAAGTGTARIVDVASGSTGSAPPTQAGYVGGISSGATGGLLGGITVCDLSVSVNQTANAQIITGVAGRKTYICGVNLVTAAANNVALVAGTGTVCATGIAGLAGGTTAATGWNFAANGGLAQGMGIGVIMQGATAADNICLLQSAATQLSGSIRYTIY